MNITPYQIIAPLVAVVAIAYAWGLWMRQKKILWEACLWTVFWGFIAVIALFPSALSYLQVVTGIKSQVNAILVTSIGLLFFMMFYIIIRLEELAQRQVRMVRKIALCNGDTSVSEGISRGSKKECSCT